MWTIVYCLPAVCGAIARPNYNNKHMHQLKQPTNKNSHINTSTHTRARTMSEQRHIRRSSQGHISSDCSYPSRTQPIILYWLLNRRVWLARDDAVEERRATVCRSDPDASGALIEFNGLRMTIDGIPHFMKIATARQPQARGQHMVRVRGSLAHSLGRSQFAEHRWTNYCHLFSVVAIVFER